MSGSGSSYRGVRALVLGGAGFIGRWTVRALHGQGAVVGVASRNTARARNAAGDVRSDVQFVEADLAEGGAVERVVEDWRPAIVFNLAGYGVASSERDAGLMEAVNATLVEQLCQALAARPPGDWPGLQLVHAGSALEYGRITGSPDESAEANPTTDYGRTKLRATRAIESAGETTGLRGAVARLFTVYGPGEHAHRLLPSLMRVAATGTRLPLTAGRQPRDFTYVEDAVEGMLRIGAAAEAAGRVLNVATGRLTTVREFATTAASVLGFDPALLDFGALPERDDEMWHGEVRIGRLRALTGWAPPTTVSEGIRRSRDYLNAA